MPANLKIGTGLILAGSLALSACATNAPEELPPQPSGTGTSTSSQPSSSELGLQQGSQADFVNFTQGADTIYFDTDRYNIDSEDAASLQKQAQWLNRYPNTRVTVEGHADERGTREYNLALGERRANAAKNYLVSLGISPSRVNTISYGKERPVALGSDEQAWAQNRRAVTVTVN
ncbi:hypothetical protein GCM10011371_18720 [Novosphingobium marinum]|uniref:Peptidoglycan-associated lipoprotein n=1 Tax=Novosphingobium marinum TaxID=1514948 RepID=A0A7Y9XZ38_9SPHN|nr:peptidoglycan-associated lipoprotein Pal [Novosphingobium marinum]NYH95985.1 peptidoglycan-associated lipoprotein [Novosphingobium marinum]GGC31573.1 hypothetical protein GCM10011371_18720 [Novosphingobium marinum]